MAPPHRNHEDDGGWRCILLQGPSPLWAGVDALIEDEVLSGNIESSPRMGRLIDIVISDVEHTSRACSSHFREPWYERISKRRENLRLSSTSILH